MPPRLSPLRTVPALSVSETRTLTQGRSVCSHPCRVNRRNPCTPCPQGGGDGQGALTGGGGVGLVTVTDEAYREVIVVILSNNGKIPSPFTPLLSHPSSNGS